MANRNMSAAMLAAISSDQISYFWLVKMEFSTPLYFTDSWKDILFGGNNYSSIGNLLSIDNIPEDLELNISTVKIVLAGANQANLAVALTSVYTDVPVTIYAGLFDSNDDVIVDPVELYNGGIINFNINEDFENENSVVTWNISNNFADFDRKAGRQASPEVQDLFFSGDTGFFHTSEIVKELTWGKQ